MSNQARFTARFDFSELLGDKKIASSSVGPNGEVILFAVAGEFEREPFGKEERKEFAIFPLSKARRRYPLLYLFASIET